MQAVNADCEEYAFGPQLTDFDLLKMTSQPMKKYKYHYLCACSWINKSICLENVKFIMQDGIMFQVDFHFLFIYCFRNSDDVKIQWPFA